MGANVSNQTIDSVTIMVSDVMNQISTQIENNVTSYVESEQTLNVSIVNSNINCSINVNQEASVTVSTMLENSTQLANDLTSQLETKIKEELENKLTQTNDGLNFGALNVSNAITSSTSYVTQNLHTLIEIGIKNSVSQNIRGEQVINFDVAGSNITCPKGGSITINQSMLIDSIAKNISTNVVNNTIKNTVKGDVGKVIKNESEQLNKGLDLNFLFGIIAIVVICGGIGYAKNRKELMKLGGDGVLGGINDVVHIISGGGKEEDDTKSNIFLAIIILCIMLYFGWYEPEKKKIKDEYDLSYIDDVEGIGYNKYYS